MLDEGTRDDNLERHPLAVLHRRHDAVNVLREAAARHVAREAVGKGLRLEPRRAALRAVEHLRHLVRRHGVHARRVERILERDVHVAVRLLIIDHDVLR